MGKRKGSEKVCYRDFLGSLTTISRYNIFQILLPHGCQLAFTLIKIVIILSFFSCGLAQSFSSLIVYRVHGTLHTNTVLDVVTIPLALMAIMIKTKIHLRLEEKKRRKLSFSSFCLVTFDTSTRKLSVCSGEPIYSSYSSINYCAWRDSWEAEKWTEVVLFCP